MLIYFAGPLFCQAEKDFNAQLTEKLEVRGFSVFLPQRDGPGNRHPPFDLLTDEELRQVIFKVDRDSILEADIFLFNLDGRVPDEGACVELGIAYAQKYLLQADKFLVGIQTDSRAAFLNAKLNAMLDGCFDFITDNEDDLLKTLEEYRQTRPLG
jgi:nucleoside 2-deoxyribosyltransferase